MSKDAKGREADRPARIGSSGWKAILRRVRAKSARDNLDVVAAGVAFYAFLSLFPALAAGVSLYGLAFDPQSAVERLDSLLTAVPAGVRDVVGSEAQRLANKPTSTLGLGLVTTLALALWSLNRSTKGLLAALDIAYHEENEHGIFARNTKSLGLAFAAVLNAGVLFTLSTAVPWLGRSLGLEAFATQLLAMARWPVLCAWILVLSLSMLYRLGPSREPPKWRWVTPGSLVATLLFLSASAGFALFVAKFDAFDRSYGALAAVAILLTWLYLSAYSVLLGAELNGETEHQTQKDSTTGPAMPMGERGAYAADTLGR